MAPPSTDPSQNQGRRGSLRLQSRGMMGQNGIPASGGLSQPNGGNSSTVDLSNSGRPPPVTTARSSGLI
jgi:hypothetical protein